MRVRLTSGLALLLACAGTAPAQDRNMVTGTAADDCPLLGSSGPDEINGG